MRRSRFRLRSFASGSTPTALRPSASALPQPHPQVAWSLVSCALVSVMVAWGWLGGARAEAAQAEAVGHNAHGAERHRRAGEDRAEEQAERGVERARGHGDADHVVDEGPE